MAGWYRGLCSCNNNSTVVFGVDTAFFSVGILSSGDAINMPDGRRYEVASYQNNTQLTLASPYLGTSFSSGQFAIEPLGAMPADTVARIQYVLNQQSGLNAGVIRSDVVQSLASDKKAVARGNIGALANGDDVSFGSLSVENSGVAQLFVKNTGGSTKNTQVIFADDSPRWRIGVDVGTNNGSSTLQVFSDGYGGTVLEAKNDCSVSIGGVTLSNGGGASSVSTGHSVGTESGTAYAQFNYGGVTIGSITQSGTSALSFNTTSDRRLKTNIRPADAKLLRSIKFVDYERPDGRHECGVIADELQKIYPDLVIGDPGAVQMKEVEVSPFRPGGVVVDSEGVVILEPVAAVYEMKEVPIYQQVNYIGLIGRMGTVIQQLMDRVDKLESQAAK